VARKIVVGIIKMEKRLSHYSCEVLEWLSQEHYIIQKKVYGRFTEDSINLVEFAKDKLITNATLLDIGTGTGIIPLSLLVKGVRYKSMVAVEKNSIMAEMTKRTVDMQALSMITVIHKDFLEVSSHSKFDALFCNPPYFPIRSGRLPENSVKRDARFEGTLTLETLLCKSRELLRPQGKLFICLPHQREEELKRYGKTLNFNITHYELKNRVILCEIIYF